MIKKIILILFLLLVTSYLLPSLAFAAEEFATSYDVLFDVGSDGITTVTEKIVLKNLTSEFFADKFKLTIGATNIFDIKAFDEGGSLTVQSEQKAISTAIEVKFNQQIMGKDKQQAWTLQFKSRDFAEKIGKVWDIRAPKISAASNLEKYNLTISTPVEFGEPSLISPAPKSQTTAFSKTFLIFEKDQLLTSGVSATFGTNQIFDFDLTYHLQNKNLVPIITNITLPPDTAYQDVIIQRIEPRVENVTVDNDGNYLAWFKLGRGQKIDVKVVGSVKLYSISKVKNPTLEPDLRRKYTGSDKYWESTHPQIQNKLAEILSPAQSNQPSEKVKLIYRYVVDSLKYDPSRLKDNIDRLGALTALANENSAVCMEFTDLFIALARAANIPARELNGFAYTQNATLRPLSLGKDVLHAWPEYWDENKGWVMVDPTWENTTGGVDYFNKLDLNHVVFAIKGFSSTQPIPAGSYKIDDSSTNDVKINFSETDFVGKANLDVEIIASNPIFAGFPSKIKVEIKNLGNSFFPSTNFTASGNYLAILAGENQKLGPIPAFGQSNFDFNIRTKSLFDDFEDTISVYIGSQKFTKQVKIKPFIIFRTAPLIAAGIISTVVVIYLTVLMGLVYRRKFLKVKGKPKKKK